MESILIDLIKVSETQEVAMNYGVDFSKTSELVTMIFSEIYYISKSMIKIENKRK